MEALFIPAFAPAAIYAVVRIVLKILFYVANGGYQAWLESVTRYAHIFYPAVR